MFAVAAAVAIALGIATFLLAVPLSSLHHKIDITVRGRNERAGGVLTSPVGYRTVGVILVASGVAAAVAAAVGAG